MKDGRASAKTRDLVHRPLDLCLDHASKSQLLIRYGFHGQNDDKARCRVLGLRGDFHDLACRKLCCDRRLSVLTDRACIRQVDIGHLLGNRVG